MATMRRVHAVFKIKDGSAWHEAGRRCAHPAATNRPPSRRSGAFIASYVAIRTAHAGAIDKVAGTTPRYSPPSPSARTTANTLPCEGLGSFDCLACSRVLTVSTGWNATVAAPAAAAPATADRAKDVSRCIVRAHWGAVGAHCCFDRAPCQQPVMKATLIQSRVHLVDLSHVVVTDSPEPPT